MLVATIYLHHLHTLAAEVGCMLGKGHQNLSENRLSPPFTLYGGLS